MTKSILTKNVFSSRSGFDPNDDITFITQTKGIQTEEAEIDILIDYKNQYNELSVVHQELERKYYMAKEKFQEAKYVIEEQDFRLKNLPMAYQQGYVQAQERLRRVEKENRELRDKLADILNVIKG